MKYERAVLLADLDGTLFTSDGLISPTDREAIREFVSGGGLFAIATGREPHNALQFLPDLPLNGPSIVLNGAAVYDFVREEYLSARRMDQEAAYDVLVWCLERGLPLDIQVYTTDGIFYATPLETAHPGFLRIHQPCSFLPPERLRDKDWMKLILLEREPDVLGLMRAYMKRKGYGERLNLVEGTTDVVKVGKYQELLPHGVTKETGVLALRRLPACRDRCLFAAGDYWNDMEMLRAVDVPCAPENAIAEVKAICGHVLPSNNNGAIAALIREVIPAEEWGPRATDGKNGA